MGIAGVYGPGRSVLAIASMWLVIGPCQHPLAAQAVRRAISGFQAVGTTTAKGEDVLLNPTLFAANGADLVVFDAAEMALKSVTRDGTLRWRQGRAGAGPGEYRHVVDVRVSREGLIAVLDEGNARLTFVDASGRHVMDTKVPTGAAKIMSIEGPGSAGLLDIRGWRLVKVSGTNSHNEPLWYPRASSELLLGETVVPVRDEGIQAAAFRWNSSVFVRRGGVTTRFTAIDSVMTPSVILREVPGTTLRVKRVDPSATEVAWGIAVAGSCIAVLGHRQDDDARSRVDFYSLDGRYLGTYELIGEAIQIDLTSRVLHLLMLDPIPTVASFGLPTRLCT